MPFLSVQGARIRYRESGGQALGLPPVVLLHGAGASSAVWLGMVGRLADRGKRRVIAPDLPGHGQSTGRIASIEEMRDAVGALWGALCLERVVLVGHSMGGLAALATASAWPEKVAGLALVTTGARLRVAQVVFAAIREWTRWQDLLAETAFSPETSAEVRRRSAGIACAASPEQTLADFQAVSAADLRPLLPGLRCPTLVVTGAHDLLSPPRLGAAMAAQIPGATLLMLERCGHMPMHEQPDLLAHGLGEFLTGIQQRT